MPYKSLSEIPNGLKNIKPPISVEQANEIAAAADAMEADKVAGAWGIAIKNFKAKYRAGGNSWISKEEKAEEADAPVAEAATYKAAAMRLARDMQTLLVDRTVPAALRKEIEDVRTMLKRTWADLEGEANGPAAEDPEPEAEEEPTEERDSHLNANLLERTYLTLESGERVKLADCVAAYVQASVKPSVPVVEALIAEPTVAEKAALVAQWTAELKAAVAEVESWLPKQEPIAESDAPVTSDPTTADETAVVIEYAEGKDQEVKLTESDIVEEPSGHVIELAEAVLGAWDGQGPLRLKTVLIEAGPGNARDHHYYPAEMLRACAPIFEGRKMYASDHKADEKSVRTEVADILRCPIGYTDKGGIVAEVGIFDPDFARKVYNRAQLGTLGNLAVSIVGAGKTRRGRVDGQDYDVVQEITDGAADFVTAAGAGGRALAISEVAQPEVSPTQEVRMLTKEQVVEALKELAAPEPVKARLAEREFESVEQVTDAVGAELSYISEASGAGKPTGLSESGIKDTPKRRTAEEHDAAIGRIINRLGIAQR